MESKIHQRVGRLMQKYPSIHKYYQIDYQIEERTIGKRKQVIERMIASMTWALKGEMDMDAGCGIYILRTSLADENRIVLNGSRFGKEFSANVFEDLFNNPNRRAEITENLSKQVEKTQQVNHIQETQHSQVITRKRGRGM